MMSKKSPELRFKGFTDDWEERKLGEVGKTKSGIGFPDAQQGGMQGTPFYKVSDMNNPGNEVVMMNANNYASDSQIKENKWNPIDPQNSGVVFAKVGAAIFLDRKRIVDTSFLIDNNMMSYLFDSSWNRYFGKTLFEKLRLSRFAQVGAIPSFNGSDVENIKVMVPEIEEQQKIGSFFKQLDEIIALHQRKLDLLEEQKKGFLQKMFPKNGAKVPELRFAGFADDWEERKLGDHAKYRRGSFPQPYGNKEWYDGEGAMPFVQVVDVTNKLTLVENTKQKISKLAQSKSVFVPKGKVVVTLQGSIGRVAITQYDSFVDRTLLIFEDYEKETDERFWAYTIQKKFEIEKIKAPGGTIKTITKEALSSFDVHLPKFEEQQKIGSFFKQLDDIIALHQRKLDLLKEQKKGFLQKMFV